MVSVNICFHAAGQGGKLCFYGVFGEQHVNECYVFFMQMESRTRSIGIESTYNIIYDTFKCGVEYDYELDLAINCVVVYISIFVCDNG